MYSFVMQGFLVGLAYVAPIGMQNAYVINSAAKFPKLKALQIAGITIFFDISLALACFFGMGLLLDRFELLKTGMLFVGSIAICYIGITLLRSKSNGIMASDLKESMAATALMCFTVTWLNPQAIIDGTLLVSTFKASLSPIEGYYFIAGVSSASIVWFSTLALVVNRFKHRMTGEVLSVVNKICGIVILYFGVKIAIQLFQ